MPGNVVETVPYHVNSKNIDETLKVQISVSEIPEGEDDAAGINASGALLNGTVLAFTDLKYKFVTNESEYLQDFDGDQILARMLKFDREKVEAVLEVGEVTVTLTSKVEYNNGIFSDMASLEGSDVIAVIEKDSKKDKTSK
ncbi:TPA: hypothetical protein HA338_03595 [Methanosarcina acetivorans]|uniref:Uncharacterized protein n=2 Tax=Methanosarcina acetivorans TaxID=2214 RepID=Q8TQM9_METAC|nr:hypothetical protein [Methanosarcina acetivorans]AAM04925.1 predicted protein [Methanosarcina acetivorans C2A]HIH93147.1 hypothetical protein [Methanosarcina acetivorans]